MLQSRFGVSTLVLSLAVIGVQGPIQESSAADWPEWLGPNREGTWQETGLVEKFPSGGPPVIWRTPVGGGYSGPAVAGEYVYLMDRQRPLGEDGKPISGNSKTGQPGKERVLCLKADNGKLVWKHEYDCPYIKLSYSQGPRTTPLVRDGRVYTLGAMGDLICLDALKGDVKWSKNLPKEYKTGHPVWGYAASLLLDGDLLYSLVGGEGSAVVAFNKDTGKEVWRALTTEDVCYSPPMIYEAGGKKQLIIWTSDTIYGLDAGTGQIFWKHAYPAKGDPMRPAVNIATPRKQGDLLFISNAYHGPMMLKLATDKPEASVLWLNQNKNPEKPEFLSSLMPSPVFKDDYVYGVSFMGELFCVEAATGKHLWKSYEATGGKKTDCGTAFIVPQGNRFILFNDLGDLILADLSPKGYKELDRARIIDPILAARGREVVWSHPAFAHRCVFARNDKEIVCVSLSVDAPSGSGTAKKAAPKVVVNKVDPKALDIVKQVCEAYKEAKSLHVDVAADTKIQEGDEKREIHVAGSIDQERPNRFALRVRHVGDDKAGLDFVSDGNNLFVQALRFKQYTEAEAPKEIAELGSKLQRLGHVNTGMLFQNLLTENPYESLVDSLTAGAYVGEEKVGETKAHHVAFKQPDMNWELWVAAEGKPVVLKAGVSQGSDDVKVATVETYKNWKFGQTPSKDAFAFKPAADVKKVNAIGAK
jgi:outer membrane protein assembly factor BamB